MDQMQSSCLYMMQMVTAQKTDTSRSKSEPSGKDDFRKLLDNCSEQASEPVSEPMTEQSARVEQEPEQGAVKLAVSQLPEDLTACPEAEDEELLLMQELAAIQMLYADQRIVTDMPAETAQPAAVQVISTAESAEQMPTGAIADTAQSEQPVQTANETAMQSVETAQTHAESEQNGAATNLPDQSIKAEVHEYTKADTAEDFEVTDAEMPVFESVETAPIKVSETAALRETASAEPVENQIADKLTETLNLGETRVELQLTPENLGKVTIELTQKEDGSLHIALQAESSQTRSLLERDLSGLQSLLSRTTQQEVQVNVSQPQEQQQQQNYDGHQQQHQQQQEQQENRRSGEDFLNQLRLGLLTPEAEAS